MTGRSTKVIYELDERGQVRSQRQSQELLLVRFSYYVNKRLSYCMALLAEMENTKARAGTEGKSGVQFWSFLDGSY